MSVRPCQILGRSIVTDARTRARKGGQEKRRCGQTVYASCNESEPFVPIRSLLPTILVFWILPQGGVVTLRRKPIETATREKEAVHLGVRALLRARVSRRSYLKIRQHPRLPLSAADTLSRREREERLALA